MGPTQGLREFARTGQRRLRLESDLQLAGHRGESKLLVPGQLLRSHLHMAYKRKSARRSRESFPPLPGESQEFEALAVSTPGFLFTHSPGGGLEFTGQYFYEYTGAPEGTATGTGWAAYLHPADLEVSLQRWNECVQSGKMFEVEYRVRRHDGEYRWFKARSTPLRGPLGTIVKWFGLAVDIHDQKLAERALASREFIPDTIPEFLGCLVRAGSQCNP